MAWWGAAASLNRPVCCLTRHSGYVIFECGCRAGAVGLGAGAILADIVEVRHAMMFVSELWADWWKR